MAVIGYRRMSGAIGLSDQEHGSRGLWWEKRRALLAWLASRGNDVRLASRPTKASAGLKVYPVSEGPFDVLMVEFGSSNAKFYGKDLAETQRLVAAHCGPLVFLCDDPDLPYQWKTVPAGEASRWTCWYNARNPSPFGGQPAAARAVDFPFSALQDAGEPSSDYNRDHLVYVGRPGGREKQVIRLIAGRVPFRAFARPAEWAALGVMAFPPPDQPARAAFYREQLGCLVLADSKHKRLGWRTGRAYHAILAGCPAVVENDHHALAEHFPSFAGPRDLVALAKEWQDPVARRAVLEGARKHLVGHLERARQVAATAGL